jgi:hypothetical protein
MAGEIRVLKESNFNLRVDPALKTAFLRAVAEQGAPAAEVLREFMRDYVGRRARLSFEAEAQRQARLIAAKGAGAAGEESGAPLGLAVGPKAAAWWG